MPRSKKLKFDIWQRPCEIPMKRELKLKTRLTYFECAWLSKNENWDGEAFGMTRKELGSLGGER